MGVSDQQKPAGPYLPAPPPPRPQLGRDIRLAVEARMGTFLALRCIHPWQVTMWLLRQAFPEYRLSKIARFGNGKNATDARNAIAAVDALVARDAAAASLIETILPELGEYDAKAARRATQNAHTKNRDHVVLRAIRVAERAALPPRKLPADRRCLDCREWFRSEWCGNLRCKTCKERNP